jgi:formiminotetrahydrofolate cyclodeaminase
MSLQDLDLETMLARIGQSSPLISGSTAALVAAQVGAAMVRMALTVSQKHGSDTDMVIERLDSIVSRVKETTESDRVASTALIETYRQNSASDARHAALIDATREPLAAAHLLVELLESLEAACEKIADNVMSDFEGGVELIGAAYRALMMAVESNLRDDGAEQLRSRTSYSRSTLRTRFDLALNRLKPAGAL